MKLVTFSMNTPIGRQIRLGILIDESHIADITSTYAAYLSNETDEPMPTEFSALRTPPDMIGWLRGGHKAREAANDALTYVKKRLSYEDNPLGLRGERPVFPRSEVRLLAPLPRPRSIRDFSIYEKHMSQAKKLTALVKHALEHLAPEKRE